MHLFVLFLTIKILCFTLLKANARKRLDDLKKAMDEAKEQAEREKHQKRLRKLEEGGHQTSRYHENFEGTN